jgi:hypothetical protein
MDSDPKSVLVAQANSLGLEVDGRWSVDTLAEKVRNAQESASQKQAAAAREAADTWVELLRDAFPVENEKHLTGETIKVRAETAKRWYKARVAIPADEPKAA